MRTQPLNNPERSPPFLGWIARLLAKMGLGDIVPGSDATSDIKFEASLAAMSDAVFIVSAKGLMTNFNDAFIRFHRFQSRQECRGKLSEYPDFFEVCTVDGHVLPFSDWPIPRALRGETATNVEHLLRRKDLNQTWYGSYSFAPITLGDGTILGAVATARDITHSKMVEEELRTLSSRLYIAISSVHLGVWDWDIKNQKLVWDDRMFELYGFPRGEFAGKLEDWQSRIHPDDRAKATADYNLAVKGEQEFDTEFRVVHKDGTVRHIKANGIVLRGVDGTPERMLGVNADITVRKNAESELKKAYAEVEAKVVQRTAALEAAKVAAEKANRAKDLFLATLSHELRSPLAAILSWSQLMERGSLSPEKMQTAIRTIKESVWSLNQLISDLLDISRITTGKLLLDSQTINVHEVVIAAIDSIRLTAEQRGISIIEDLNGTDVYINADPARLKQSLWNLLSNAIKFTPRGGKVFVAVNCEGNDPDKKLVIQVRDTGRGIKGEFLPHLFDRFSQADPSSIRIHGGMGLGLSLVKSLVELQGGTISGDSPGEGQGATFTMTFPLLPMSDRITSFAYPVISGEAATLPDGLKGVRVLLVEDGDKTREALHHLLERHGASVDSAASAHDAISSFDHERPDVIVSDIAMPLEDGHSLLRKIRTTRGEWGAKVPAIALTAFAEPKDRNEAFASGFQEYLTKPVDEAVLTSAILRLVPKSTDSSVSKYIH